MLQLSHFNIFHAHLVATSLSNPIATDFAYFKFWTRKNPGCVSLFFLLIRNWKIFQNSYFFSWKGLKGSRFSRISKTKCLKLRQRQCIYSICRRLSSRFTKRITKNIYSERLFLTPDVFCCKKCGLLFSFSLPMQSHIRFPLCFFFRCIVWFSFLYLRSILKRGFAQLF